MCRLSNNFSPSYISPVPITQSVNFIQNLSNKCGYATGINTAVNKKNRCSFKRSPFTYQHPLCMIADGGRIRWSELCVGHRTRWCQLLWGCICSTNYVILPTHKIWQWDQLANFSFFFSTGFSWCMVRHWALNVSMNHTAAGLLFASTLGGMTRYLKSLKKARCCQDIVN